MSKEEKWTPHIIAAAAFVVFIVLGLACANTPARSQTSSGPTPAQQEEAQRQYEEALRRSQERAALFRDFRMNGTELVAYLGNATDVTIPEGVTAIGERAFSEKRLTSVIIPDSVNSIGDFAFQNKQLTSNQLTSVTIPDSVTTIGENAFESNRLTSVTIGNSVTTIEYRAFYNNQLTSVTIPDSVTTIGENAFQNNPLTSISFGNGIRSFTTTWRNSGDPFDYDNFTRISIGANVDMGNFGNVLPWGLFVIFYNANGKRAGTYTFNNSNGRWSAVYR